MSMLSMTSEFCFRGSRLKCSHFKVIDFYKKTEAEGYYLVGPKPIKPGGVFSRKDAQRMDRCIMLLYAEMTSWGFEIYVRKYLIIKYGCTNMSQWVLKNQWYSVLAISLTSNLNQM
jgi:hypothetical protein